MFDSREVFSGAYWLAGDRRVLRALISNTNLSQSGKELRKREIGFDPLCYSGVT